MTILALEARIYTPFIICLSEVFRWADNMKSP